jgi:hypothetical protein
MSARGLVALRKGDHETVLRCLEISQKLGQGFGNEPSSLGHALAQAFFSTSLNGLIECFWTPGWKNDADALLRSQGVLQQWDLADLAATGIRGELASAFDAIEWTKQAQVEDYTGAWGSSARWEGVLLGAAPDGWFDNNAAYLGDLFERHLMPTLGDRKFARMIPAAELMDKELLALNSLEEVNLYLVDLMGLRQGRMLRYAAFGEAYRRMALTVCALHRYRLAHGGSFPEELAQLIPDYLDAVLLDPIDGMPLRYERMSGAEAEAVGGFRLYSIGFDASDDGGEVRFDPERPYRLRLNRDSYLGDWAWPVLPIDLEPAGADQEPAAR